MKAGAVWVFQCKHTTTGPAPRSAVEEVVAAGQFYKADRLVIALSRPAGDAILEDQRKYARLGLKVEIAAPRHLIGMANQSPLYPPSRRNLRDYQEDASQRFRQALLDTGRGQIVLATGLGKTVVMADTVADLLSDGLVKEGRVLVLGHTRALVDQLQRAFWHQLPNWVHTHRLTDGEFPSYWDGITFATVQSVMSQIDRLPEFGLVLVDEAHHLGAETFRETIAELKAPMLAGVTATPWRGDGFDLDSILGPPLVKLGIAEALSHGFLSEVDYRLMADNLDWKTVQTLSRNRYSLTELNRKLILPTRDEEAARIIRSTFFEERRRSGIVFSPTILHANAFAGILRHCGFRAEAISSELDARERDALLSRFKAGQLDFVTTVDMFNEGVDVPDVDTLVFMRVTHSRRIFVQQLGRGLRLSPNKDKVLVLDFVTDLRRVAEVMDLDRAARGNDVERLGMGPRLIQFRDVSAGSFMREWMLDQASLFLREESAALELPELDFPMPHPHGGVQ
ncbi:DNA/RNA helicase (DEAD/DEAH BOX family) [Myxococcus hansupus]|uniref:DNA/RNA helicase (DEAD/DEAH BOX family) n=1 Tax=Pseudomyxococcus hansupus TaxID=1297742 RepID=A0A0H4X3Z1_9BACT|nr:DNA/RNA helicase (DEAD/DEAH BOX family) [Myxococcus hansupus]